MLVPVYDALEVPWLPETVGSVEEELGGAEYEAVAEAILAEFGARYGLYDGAISDPTLRDAEGLVGEHLAG